MLLVPCRSAALTLPGNNPFHSILRSNILNRSFNCSTNFRKTLTLISKMGTSSKRPMCPSCSKPTRICLCNRFKTPILDNSVAVTILQHILEKDHPLNSTRIAVLGLKNLGVEWVSDVNFQAHFDIDTISCQASNEHMVTAELARKDNKMVAQMKGTSSEEQIPANNL